jgi:hypothetical protein
VRFEARFLGPLLERRAALTERKTLESPRGARRNHAPRSAVGADGALSRRP